MVDHGSTNSLIYSGEHPKKILEVGTNFVMGIAHFCQEPLAPRDVRVTKYLNSKLHGYHQ